MSHWSYIMPKEDKVQSELDAIDMELKQIQLEQARMQLQQTKEQVAQWQGQQDAKARGNAQRQHQMKVDRIEAARAARNCTHRQGGSIREPNRGKGMSALAVVILPDESMLIMCANCRMRVFSPNPLYAQTDTLKGETQSEAKARVARYKESAEAFQKLLEEAEDKLTPEAAAPMHCGKTFKFVDKNLNQVHVPRPCDSYAQGLDSRIGDKEFASR